MSESNVIQLKVVMLGDCSVGKTSIVNSFMKGETPENVQPTISAAFVQKTIFLQGCQFDLRVWDTSGQEMYRGVAPMYYRNANIALIVFDITNQKSFDVVDFWVQEIKKNVGEQVVILVIGNKLDLEQDRKVNQFAAEKWCNDHGVLYNETSAKDGTQVERSFQLCASRFVNVKPTSDQELNVVNLSSSSPNKSKNCC